MNKKKFLLYATVITGCAGLGVLGGQILTTSNVTAQPKSEQEQVVEQVSTAYAEQTIQMVLVSNITSDLEKYGRSTIEIPEQVLDNYAYYLINYAKDSRMFLSLDSNTPIYDPIALLSQLLELYEKQGYEKPYHIEDGQLALNRPIKAPTYNEDLGKSLRQYIEKLPVTNNKVSVDLSINFENGLFKEVGETK